MVHSTANERASYAKTLIMAGAAAFAVFVAAVAMCALAPAHETFITVAASAVSLVLWVTVLAGLIVLHRDRLWSLGRRDAFLAATDIRNEDALSSRRFDFGLTVRRLVRSVFAPKRLVVGDRVRVRSFDAIRTSLDRGGCLNNLPFMPEMVRFCGSEALVFRSVDKVYDYGGKKNLRRMERAVLLQHMRCDGAAHGGCQAACYLLWKEEWLERLTDSKSSAPDAAGQKQSTRALTSAEPNALGPQSLTDPAGVLRYSCQFTKLASASTSPKRWDPMPDIRPLLSGNVNFRGWLTVLLTRWFNFVQGIRGGLPFPALPAAMRAESVAAEPLYPGARVRVRPPLEIAVTLDKNSKNRGLWFDRDMLKHCGHTYTVLRRVDQIIDDATGQMRQMKTPCIVLDNVNYSGEGLRFCAQEENLYWREAWLARDESSPQL